MLKGLRHITHSADPLFKNKESKGQILDEKLDFQNLAENVKSEIKFLLRAIEERDQCSW